MRSRVVAAVALSCDAMAFEAPLIKVLDESLSSSQSRDLDAFDLGGRIGLL